MIKSLGITHAEGRGFYGHKGIPGHRGGSIPRAGGGEAGLPAGVKDTHKMLVKMSNDGGTTYTPQPEAPAAGGKKSSNSAAKMRKVEDPYEVWQSQDGWEWRVLKKYQSPEKEASNPFARWMCAVKSPFTFGSWEYGDTYVKDVKSQATRVK